MNSMNRLFCIRGAVCTENKADAIIKNVELLFNTILKENDISNEKDFVSIQFTVTTDIDELNQKFYVYEGRNIYIQDVVSIINLAKNINEKKKIQTKINVEIPENVLDGIEIKDEEGHTIPNSTVAKNIQDYLEEDDINQIISLHLEDSYTCKLEFSEKSQYIDKITINNIE